MTQKQESVLTLRSSYGSGPSASLATIPHLAAFGIVALAGLAATGHSKGRAQWPHAPAAVFVQQTRPKVVCFAHHYACRSSRQRRGVLVNPLVGVGVAQADSSIGGSGGSLLQGWPWTPRGLIFSAYIGR
jgi:hypothetical protein